jgi:hypothetical protein
VASRTDLSAVPVAAEICWTMFSAVPARGTCSSATARVAAVIAGMIVIPTPTPVPDSAPISTQYGVSARSWVVNARNPAERGFPHHWPGHPSAAAEADTFDTVR